MWEMDLKGTRTTPVSETSILLLAFFVSFLPNLESNRRGDSASPLAPLPARRRRRGKASAGFADFENFGKRSFRGRERGRGEKPLTRRFVAAEEWITKLRALAKVQRDPELEPRGIREGTISSAMLVGIWSRVDWSSFRVSGEINARILTRADPPIDALV